MGDQGDASSGLADAAPPAVATDQAQLWQWQRSLAPFMLLAVLATSIFFFAGSYIEFQSIKASILNPADISDVKAMLDRPAAAGAETPDDLHWKVTALARYQSQAKVDAAGNALLLVNVWIRYLGFVTGMVLAIVGATFIMAKLNEGATALNASGAGFTGSVSTSSPGIILVVLGTVLMLAAMAIRFSVQDSYHSVPSAPRARESARDAEGVTNKPVSESDAKSAPEIATSQ